LHDQIAYFEAAQVGREFPFTRIARHIQMFGQWSWGFGNHRQGILPAVSVV